MSLPMGLDYVAVDIVRRARKIKPSEDLWEKLATLEAEALTIFGEQIK